MARGKGRARISQLKRRGPFRKPRERILIVCEGEKTEKLYFSLFLDSLRAVNVELRIVGKECGSDPLSVINYGKEKFSADEQMDHCYCVIDRDSHAHFGNAVEEARVYANTLSGNRSFQTIKSYPCFEYWLISHFVYSRAPFSKTGSKSPGDCAVDALKKHIPNFKKSSSEQLAELLPHTEKAITNSERSMKEAMATSEFNPSSEVHVLVQKIKSAISG